MELDEEQITQYNSSAQQKICVVAVFDYYLKVCIFEQCEVKDQN